MVRDLWYYWNVPDLIFLFQMYSDEDPEEDEQFFVELTSVVRLPSGSFNGK